MIKRFDIMDAVGAPPSWHDSIAGRPAQEVHACHCVGPKNGQPLCPCMMRSVKIVDGRYVQIIDHGPAPKQE